MFKDFFNFKRGKSVPEAIVFYAVTAIGFLVLVNGAERFLTSGF